MGAKEAPPEQGPERGKEARPGGGARIRRARLCNAPNARIVPNRKGGPKTALPLASIEPHGAGSPTATSPVASDHAQVRSRQAPAGAA